MINKTPQQYAPWTEDDEDEDDGFMTDEEIAVASKKVAELMRKEKDEPSRS
jgi:hypothetical protein